MKSILVSQLKTWFKPSRLIPLLTILGAGAGIILSLLKVLQLTTAEEIIISLLALLSIDALNERIGTLEKIETLLSRISAGETLKRRVEILTPVEHAKQASEIWINVIHGTSVIFPYASFYESKLKSGCNIRVVVLNPISPSLPAWSLLAKHTHTEQYIDSTLECLNGLMSLKTKGKCEVRLSNVFLPFSIFAVEPRKETGSMIVEYHSYKVSIDDRPHVRLTAADSHWFEYYRQQFEQLWNDSTIWNP
jgi:hypothetical protein